MIVVRDTGPKLVHAHDRGIDHLHRRIMTSGQRIHDLVPRLPPAASERSDYNKWCGDQRPLAGRAGAHPNGGPKRCH